MIFKISGAKVVQVVQCLTPEPVHHLMFLRLASPGEQKKPQYRIIRITYYQCKKLN
jgi:hypothetical protein